MEQYGAEWRAAQHARAEQDRGGNANPLIGMAVYGVEDGRMHAHNDKPGPLDGQPRRKWYATATYADGQQRTWGPTYQ